MQPRNKRTRMDCYIEEPDKENMSKNVEHDRFIQTKKLRKEVYTNTSLSSTTFMLTPVKFNETKKRMSETQVLDYNFSSQNESLLLTEEHVERKILRRETYVTTPKYRQNLINIQENDESVDNFDDSLSPRKPQGTSDFSFLIDNINFTPKFPTTPDEVFEFSPQGCSTGNKSEGSRMIDSINSNTTFSISDLKLQKESKENNTCFPLSSPNKNNKPFIKPTRLVHNFEALTPITPAPQRKTEFASSSLLSTDFSNLETPKRFTNTSYRNLDSSSVKEVLEADMWVKPQNIFPIRRMITEKALENTEKNQLSNSEKTFEIDDSKNLLLEISPPKPHRPLHRMSPRKHHRPAEKIKKISPSKNGKVNKNHETAQLKKKQVLTKSFKNNSVSIPGVRIANLSLAGITRKKGNQSLKTQKEISVKLHDPNDFIMKFCNPDPFAATTTADPFLSSTLFYDEKWVFQQEKEFQKWLNALMTPPEHLNTDVETNCVDIAKVWQSCRMKENVLAESKESVSARYHTNTRLNTLRKAACAMFRSNEVINALAGVTSCIEKEKILVIRDDKDLHRDIGLQKEILELFLSYNPLWLRIGLETVYGETIPLHSNNDLVGLTRFLISRFFSDPFIIKQHSHPTVVGMKLPSFTSHINKFMLRKFLLLVYFLDYAKTNKLIGHNPCLFHKKAPHKDSRSILLTFSREILSGIGDITKVLRSHKYVVQHKQTYLDEFDYAVNDMSSDLRDGVRLCRAMELITGKRDLTCHCRVPAISRLQKVHNVNIALTALLDSGYVLTGDIDPKSIADGHREKTLSLLWQIIYKFQAPRFNKAASCLQTWWRSKLWLVRVKNLLKKHRNDAASVIQRAWRCYLSKQTLNRLRVEYEKNQKLRNEAARVIQQRWIFRREGIRQRNKFLETISAVVKIQRWLRRTRETKPFVESFRKKRRTVILVQRIWRGKKLMQKERSEYLKLRDVCYKIQGRWRGKLAGRAEREEFEKLKKAVLLLQTKWRALKLMKQERESYERVLIASRQIQKWWRRVLIMKMDRNNFLLMKYAVKVFEKMWIEKKTINEDRNKYLEKRRSTVIIQRAWRRYRETKPEVSRLRACKMSSIKIQSWWRSVIVQKEFRIKKNSCLKIQNWWKSVQKTKACQAKYLKTKKATIVIQKNWKMVRVKRNYWQIKSAVLSIESWYENILISRSIREEFLRKKNVVKLIETWWLNLKTSRLQREKYIDLKTRVIDIQRRWRVKKLTQKTQENYQQMKSASVKIQSWFRMLIERRKFKSFMKRHNAAIIIQRRWRATLSKRKAQAVFKKTRESIVILQRKWRATKLARLERIEFLKIKKAVLNIQRQWRSYSVKKDYERKRKAAIELQSWWRHKISGIKVRAEYLRLRRITIYLQNRVRRNQLTLKTREDYLRLRAAAIKIQRRWREVRLGNKVRQEFVDYRRAVIVAQSNWKMIIKQRKYNNIKKACLTIQSFWRARVEGKKARNRFLELKSAATVVQRHHRANKLRKIEMQRYLTSRKAILLIQRKWRAKIQTRECVKEFIRCKTAVVKIQSWWRSILIMRECRNNYLQKKSVVISFQRRYRAKVLAKEIRREYEDLRKAVLTIQAYWKLVLARRRLKELLILRKKAVLLIEVWWEEVLRQKKIKEEKAKEARRIGNAATKIQAAWRGHKVRQVECAKMAELRERAERAARRAIPAETLSHRLQESINVFLFSNDLGRLSMCLSSLGGFGYLLL